MTRIRATLSYANVMATVAVFLALGGGAYALQAGPGSTGVIHGCVNTQNGALRIVKSGGSCQKAKTITRHGRRIHVPGEQAIAWNQQGPPGINGTNGLNGINGTNGLNGTNGATNIVVRTMTMDDTGGSNGVTAQTVNCNPGERAVGGGVSRSNGGVFGNDSVEASYPAVAQPGGGAVPAPAGSTPNAWGANLSFQIGTVFVWYVVCASP